MTDTAGKDAVDEINVVAARLWFEHIDMQGYPNDMPTWDELKAMAQSADWSMTYQEFICMASGAIDALDWHRAERAVKEAEKPAGGANR